MDFIYSKLDNNLVDINRIDKILLLICTEKDNPIEGLNVGDYYLKLTIIDSNRVSYCNLGNINKNEKQLLNQIYEEINRAQEAEKEIRKTLISLLEAETKSRKEVDNSLEIKIENEAVTRKENDDILKKSIGQIEQILPIVVKLDFDFIDMESQIDENDPNYTIIKNAIKQQAETNNTLIFVEKSGYPYVLSYIESKPLSTSEEYYNYYFTCVDEDTIYYLNFAFNDRSYNKIICSYDYNKIALDSNLKKVQNDIKNEISRATSAESDINKKKQDKLTAGTNITISNNVISAIVDVNKEYVDGEISSLFDELTTIDDKVNNLDTKLNEETTNRIRATTELSEKIKVLTDIVDTTGANTLAELSFDEII